MDTSRTDQILSNKTFLIFGLVDKSEDQTKSITLRGSGTYIVSLSCDDDCFRVIHGSEDIDGLKVKLAPGKDVMLKVKFKPKQNGKIYLGTLKLTSISNKRIVNNMSFGKCFRTKFVQLVLKSRFYFLSFYKDLKLKSSFGYNFAS